MYLRNGFRMKFFKIYYQCLICVLTFCVTRGHTKNLGAKAEF